MYKKAYIGKRLGHNEYKIFLWEEDDERQTVHYENVAYQQCQPDDAFTVGLNGEPLKPLNPKDWKFSSLSRDNIYHELPRLSPLSIV